MQLRAPLRPTGETKLLVMRGNNPFGSRQAHHLWNVIKFGLPRPGLEKEVNAWRWRNLPNLFRGLPAIWFFALLQRLPFSAPLFMYGASFYRVKRNGAWVELGLASCRVITTAGVNSLATRFANTSPANIANFKFHAFGTGTTAEAIGDTALVTEFTTEYNPNSTRPTGSQSSSTNTYTTVATFTPDSGGVLAVTEHGLMDQAATGGGVLWDRTKFSPVNLDSANADSLQVTHITTFTAGG